MARGNPFSGTMRSGFLGAALFAAAVLPAYATSDIVTSGTPAPALPANATSNIAIIGNAVLTTDYVDRGITASAENPAVLAESYLYYKETYYAGIYGANVDFGAGPNGQELASMEIDYYVGVTPTLGKWNFDIAAYYITYPGAFDPDGEFDYFELWTGVDRSFFNDKLKLTIYNYWSPEFFGETGNNDVLEFSYEWKFNKVWNFSPTLKGQVGHQWGDLSEGGFNYTYWNVGLAFGFNKKPPLSLDIRYWDTGDFNGFTCPPSGVFACDERIVVSLKASFGEEED